MTTTKKEWRAPFHENAVLKFYKTAGSACTNIIKGDVQNPTVYQKKYIACTENDAKDITKYLSSNARKNGIIVDEGKLSNSNIDTLDSLGLTKKYLQHYLDGDLKQFANVVMKMMTMENWVKLDEYRGKHNFGFVVIYVDEINNLYMKASLSPYGRLYVDLHPRGWRK